MVSEQERTRNKELRANRLKDLRKEKGWTQEEAAQKMDVRRSRYQNWECAARTPEIDTFPTIGKVFNVDPAYAAGWVKERGTSSKGVKYVSADQQLVFGDGLRLIDDSIAFSQECLSNRRLSENRILLLSIVDDSMSPELNKGDSALVDLSKTQIEISTDIFAIRDSDNKIWFRWVRKEMGGGYTIYANDKNHSEDIQMNEEQFKKLDILGRLVWSGRWR